VKTKRKATREQVAYQISQKQNNYNTFKRLIKACIMLLAYRGLMPVKVATFIITGGLSHD